MFLNVLGNPNRKEMIKPITLKMIVQAPWSVIAFNATPNVKICAPMIKIKTSSCPTASTSRPMGPPINIPQSA